MANIFQILRSQTSGTPPAGHLYGELAYSENSNSLFYCDHTNSWVAIAGAGLFAKLASPNFTGSPTAPTPVSSDNSVLVATTAFVKAQGYISGNQSIAITGDGSGSGTVAITLTLATVVSPGTNTKLTYNAKGLITAGTSLSSSDVPQTLTHLWITDFDTQVRTNRLDQLAAPTGAVSLNSQSLTNLGAPVNANDAATKTYVDSVSQGLQVKQACAVATTANITLSGLQTLDGYTTIAGDRVLVKNQTTASQNGIYLAASGAWARASDMDTSGEVQPGDFVFVETGTLGAATSWVLTSLPPITLGSTSLTWAQFGGAGTYSAGNGMTMTGTQFSVVGTTNRISVSGSGVDISSSYVGQSSITTLGTLVACVFDAGTF